MLKVLQNQKMNRLVTVLVLVCVLSASFCISVEPADASVLVPALVGACAGIEAGPALLLGATILTAAGVVFATGTADEVIQTAAANLINNNPAINAFVAEMVAAGSVASFFLTDEVCAELASWLDGVFSAESGTVELPSSLSGDWGSVPVLETDTFSFTIDQFREKYSSVCGFPAQDLYFTTDKGNGNYQYYKLSEVSSGLWSDWYYLSSSLVSSDDIPGLPYKQEFTKLSGFVILVKDSVYKLFSFLNSTYANFGTILDTSFVLPAVSAAADATYFPQSTDEEKKLAPGIPLTVPSSISDLVDMPMDQIRGTTADPDLPIEGEVDAAGTITGDGTGTGVFEGIGNWIIHIPILGLIYKILQEIFTVLGSVWNLLSASTLMEWLQSIWEAITGGFEDVLKWFSSIFESITQFFKDCLQLLKDILSSLAGFLEGILSFIPDILAWLASYTLFSDLISRFLPQPVAVVIISFFLASIAIWLFRMLLDR